MRLYVAFRRTFPRPVSAPNTGHIGRDFPGCFRHQIFQFVQLVLVYELAGSIVALGVLGAANTAPTIVFGVIDGVFANRRENRRIIILTQGASSFGVLLVIASSWRGSYRDHGDAAVTEAPLLQRRGRFVTGALALMFFLGLT